MSRLTDEQKAEIVRYGDRGKKGQWIAARMGLKPATVHYQLLRAGIDPWDSSKRNNARSQPGAFSADEDARLLELAKSMKVSHIAKALGRARTSVIIRLMTLEVRAEERAAK